MLEVAGNALEKVCRDGNPDLTNQERLALECILLMYGRPALEVSQDGLANPPPNPAVDAATAELTAWVPANCFASAGGGGGEAAAATPVAATARFTG